MVQPDIFTIDIAKEYLNIDEETLTVYLIAASGRFDAAWYLTQYPDVADTDIDPILHYVRYGVGEGRKPAPWFDIQQYTATNDDVANSHMNPFLYYLYNGVQEGRKTHKI